MPELAANQPPMHATQQNCQFSLSYPLPIAWATARHYHCALLCRGGSRSLTLQGATRRAIDETSNREPPTTRARRLSWCSC